MAEADDHPEGHGRWTRRLTRFLTAEAGAASVDTVVVAAGVAGLALAVLSTLSDGMLDTAGQVGSGMTERVQADADVTGQRRDGDAEAGVVAEADATAEDDEGAEDAPAEETETGSGGDAESAAQAGSGESGWQRLLRVLRAWFAGA